MTASTCSTPVDREHLDFPGLCGRSVWVYGQTEVVKDLIAAGLAAGQPIEFEISGTALHDLETDRPRITYADSAGVQQVLECDVVAGCDGFHGPQPADAAGGAAADLGQRTTRSPGSASWPMSPPSTDELIYAWHPDGFALHSMRSPSVSRLYLQVDPDERLESWSDDRIWAELQHRMALEGWQLRTGARSPTGRSRRCAASSAPRCATAGSSSPATRPTSCRPPAPRG